MPTSIAVCESGPCTNGGSDTVVRAIEDLISCMALAAGGVPIKVTRTGCLNLCDHAPNAVLNSPPANPHIAKRLDRFPAILALVQRAADGGSACLPPAHVLKACELHWTAINAQVVANHEAALRSATQGLGLLDGTGCTTASEAPVEEIDAESGRAALKAVSNQLQCLADGHLEAAFALNGAANQVVFVWLCSHKCRVW